LRLGRETYTKGKAGPQQISAKSRGRSGHSRGANEPSKSHGSREEYGMTVNRKCEIVDPPTGLNGKVVLIMEKIRKAGGGERGKRSPGRDPSGKDRGEETGQDDGDIAGCSQ